MNLKDLTIGEIQQIEKMFFDKNVCLSDAHWNVGENYMIRTVTHINIGTLIAVTDKELVLKNASWIADTGRFEQAVKDGSLSEVEPFPDEASVIVGRGALVDAVIWKHPLPRKQK